MSLVIEQVVGTLGKALRCRLISAAVLMLATLFSLQSASVVAQEARGVATLLPDYNPTEVPKAVVVYDLSGSMFGEIPEGYKFQVTRDVVKQSLAEVEGNLDLGFVSFGHRTKTCNDIQVIARPTGKRGSNGNDTAVIKGFLNTARPVGRTPLAASIDAAGKILEQHEGTRSIIVFSDGLESCGGDPCAVAERLNQNGIGMRLNVIGLDLDKDRQKKMRCIAENGGGTFAAVSSIEELSNAFGGMLQDAVDYKQDLGLLRIGELVKAENEAAKKLRQINAELEKKLKVLEGAEQKADRLEGKVETLEIKQAELLTNLIEQTDKADALKISLAQAASQKSNLIRDLEEAWNQVQSAERLSEEAADKMWDAQNALEAGQARVAGLEAQIEQGLVSLDLAAAQNDELQLNNQALEGALAAERRDNQNLVAVRDQLDQDILDLEDRLRTLQGFVQAQDARIAQRDETIRTLELALEEEQAKLDTIKGPMTALRSSNQVLATKLLDAQAKTQKGPRIIIDGIWPGMAPNVQLAEPEAAAATDAASPQSMEQRLEQLEQLLQQLQSANR